MAQMQADYRDGAEDVGIPVGRLINGTAAVMSLALLVGVGVWGYRTVMRDVSGVPVIRAAAGEMRVRPETPGGTPAAHQGLAVNAVAAEGSAAKVPDQVTLAPRFVGLADEDVAEADLPDRGGPMPEAPAVKPAEVATVEELPAEPEVDAEGNATDAGIRALAASLASGATTFTASASAEDLPEPEQAVSRPEYGLADSLRPRQRPAALKAAFAGTALGGALPVAAAVESGPITSTSGSFTVRDIDPTTIETGTRLAQLGAYESEEDARKDWLRLNASFEDYMEGKDRVIQKASSGGRTFYRLRAMGFTDLSDARRFCAAFVAQDAECIPVVTR